jgi:DNA topoisomerase III
MEASKWLIVTEKPSVAADIAKAIGGFEKVTDYYDSDKYYITWAVGHLLELMSPEDIDIKYKRWLLQDLPILPEKFQYKPKEGQKERLEVIKSLATKKSIIGLINACDAGREGELIFREIAEFCKTNKPVKRLWLQSMTPASIRTEFKSLKDGKEFDNLGDAARCRAESDWLIGMNGTRAVTRRLRPKVQKGVSWSVGRVQTPTLAILVKRENEILKHRPEPFWTIEGRFSTDTHEYSGQWFDPTFQKTISEDEDTAVREKEDRIFKEQTLKNILEDIEKNKGKCTASETRKESKEIAPQLFDLTSLQREANRKFGMPASRTLQSAQRLYEKHKLLTYPRTDSKYLPNDYRDTVKETLAKLSECSGILNPVCKKLSKEKKFLNDERVFNSEKVSDHFAIVPTGEDPGTKLEGDDARIFDLVLKRFLAAFMPHAVWARVERISSVGKSKFRTRVQDLTVPGWREVYGLDTQEESKLPSLNAKEGQNAAVVLEEVQSVSQQTKPLPRLSEAKLLSLMENCGRSVKDEEIAEALGERGLGTPATRADCIENLIIKEYISRSGKALKATAKGIRLIDVLTRIPVDGLSQVELTGEMEHQLKMIEKGQMKRVQYMKQMYDYTTQVVERTREFDYDLLYKNTDSLGVCPSCSNGKVLETFWAYKCSNSIVSKTKNPKTETELEPQENSCSFLIWKEKNQRYIDRSLVADVLTHKSFGPIEFQTNSGSTYEAKVCVTQSGLFLEDENGKPIEGNSLADATILSEEYIAETFLKMPGKIIETEIAYKCEFGAIETKSEIVEEAEEKIAASKKSKSSKVLKTKPKKPAKPPKKLGARMPKVLCGHNVSMDEFKLFITTGATPAITDFKSKKGRPFAARLHLKENGNFEFKFESRKKLLGEVEDAASKTPKTPKKTASKAKVVKKVKKEV